MAAAAPEMAIAVAPAEEDVDLMTEMAIDMPAAATVVEDLVSMEAELVAGASAEDVTAPAVVTVLEAMSPTMEEAAAVVSVPLATTDVKEVEEVAIATEAVALETTAPLIGSTELEVVVVVVVVTMISTTASDTFRMAMTRTLPRRATSPRTNMTF